LFTMERAHVALSFCLFNRYSSMILTVSWGD
jgi:hypothetical protein